MEVRGWVWKRQVWAFCAELASGAMVLLGLIFLKPAWALGWAILTVVLATVTRKWANQDPMPIPYIFHWGMLGPRPFQSSRRLIQLLGVHDGDRLLEVGPATGKYALPVAASLNAGGILDVLDIQPRMVDGLMRRASGARIANIVPTVGDIARMPYTDGQFDAAYMVAVLGEIPAKDAALQELRRVLKPEGCLVVGEFFIDPDFISLLELEHLLDRIGFTFERKMGPSWAYLARFKKRA